MRNEKNMSYCTRNHAITSLSHGWQNILRKKWDKNKTYRIQLCYNNPLTCATYTFLSFFTVDSQYTFILYFFNKVVNITTGCFLFYIHPSSQSVYMFCFEQVLYYCFVKLTLFNDEIDTYAWNWHVYIKSNLNFISRDHAFTYSPKIFKRRFCQPFWFSSHIAL